jgi:AcrR family transcriptional regulator/DNA-binding XRE family transcriptional regulator
MRRFDRARLRIAPTSSDASTEIDPPISYFSNPFHGANRAFALPPQCVGRDCHTDSLLCQGKSILRISIAPWYCSDILNNMTLDEVELTTSETVRQLRIARGLSVRGLAERVSVSPATISAIENGKTGISVQRLHEIAVALDVPMTSLVGGPMTLVPLRGASNTLVVTSSGNWRDFAPLPIDPVLAGAIQSFVATGYHGASMRSIAEFAHMSVPGIYHHYPSKQALLVRILDITMMDLLWRLRQARDEGNRSLERVALVVEALALFHARRSDLAFIGASEMRSLESSHYRQIAKLRDDVQQLLDLEIAMAITTNDLKVKYPRDAGKAIATMCTALTQWFQPDGPTSPEQIAKKYAQFALGLLGCHDTY